MKVYDKLVRVSKASFSEKLFNLNVEKLSRAERKKLEPLLPTEEEKDFLFIFQSRSPQLARLQRKISVCLDVEVTELEEEKITFLFGGSSYTLTDPPDAWRICQALEKGALDGLSEMAVQGCVLKDGKPVDRIKGGPLKIDEMRVLEKVADKFFFQIFLT